jgi:hypothetical protein
MTEKTDETVPWGSGLDDLWWRIANSSADPANNKEANFDYGFHAQRVQTYLESEGCEDIGRFVKPSLGSYAARAGSIGSLADK